MFGYVRPNMPELRVREKQRYEAWYCGLCRTLGRRLTQTSRLVLSYDCAFLAMLASAARGYPSPCEKRACPVHPFSRRKQMVLTENPALEYAADVCVLLADFKIRDDVRDGRPLRRAAALPLHRAFRKARKRQTGLYKLIGERIDELTGIEKEQEKSIDLAANCFGELMRGIFVGALGEKADADLTRVFSEIGFFLGRAIYLMDAWDDREKDAKHGLYNPFNLCETSVEEAEFAVNFSINSAISAYNLLETEGERHPDLGIADNVFYEGLFAMWESIKAKKDGAKAKENGTERMEAN